MYQLNQLNNEGNGYDLKVPTFPHRFPKAHERLFKDLALAYRRSLISITDGKRERTTESEASRELIERLAEVVYSVRNEITGERLVLSEAEEIELEAARQAARQAEKEARTRAMREALEAAERARLEAEAREKKAERARAELAEQLRLETIAQEIRQEREQVTAANRKETKRLNTINKQVDAALAAVEAEAKAKAAKLEAEQEKVRLKAEATEQARLKAEARETAAYYADQWEAALKLLDETKAQKAEAEVRLAQLESFFKQSTTALEKQLNMANQEIEQLRDRLAKLEKATPATTPAKRSRKPKSSPAN
jgi:chromosome segregation ATPase